MAKTQYTLVSIENKQVINQSYALFQNIQAALLLSLLDKGLLTQRQFSRCEDEIKKTKCFENKPCIQSVKV